ncbi:TRAP transporter small permease subunit [Neptunomonas antarctica]|uniref:TRAP transporter small permease protein n=1 Tax=Neptunomonas antarctica TaxID=619304 RepID=A0A1N7L850_9GAMM|nr:TRAP transporter small permease subunit [Neptunomonas antarctica]SIS69996.1 TRAP-type mannitol/chloroaromatic compound transport system, small permease component [Neptunomonas antarctica]
MKVFSRFFDRLSHGMHVISGIILVSMMFVTLADVLARLLFDVTDGGIDLTFIGGVELIKYGLLMMVLFALPYSIGRSQVIVDLFTEKFSARMKAVLEGTYMLGFVALGGGMSYRFIHAVGQSQMTGETTQDLLIPLYYLYAVSAFATAMLCIAALLISLRCLFFWKGDNIS